MIRLVEVLLSRRPATPRLANRPDPWSHSQGLRPLPQAYSLSQLRYDLR